MVFWTPQTRIPVDFLFVNYAGNIVKIVHSAKPLSKKKYSYFCASAVLEINGGDCKKFGIKKGDTVVNSALNLSSENQFFFHNFMFNKLKSSTFNKMNANDVAFAAIATGGAMGWGGTNVFFTKDVNTIKKYMLTGECINSKKSIDRFFNAIIHLLNWKFYDLGMGNCLYIKPEYYEQFVAEIKKSNLKRVCDVYKDWCRIAYDILTGKSDKSKNTWIKQKYYGIDSSNINKVLSPEWWKKIEYDDFNSMTSDGRYLDITIQNTDKTVLDLGIENCKNNEILEVLKYHKEKEDILKYRRQ